MSTNLFATQRRSSRRAFMSSFNVGDIASDLYGPQFWDDNFQFSFSVVVSCKSNKQLGYF